jgi:hypothetical protein
VPKELLKPSKPAAWLTVMNNISICLSDRRKKLTEIAMAGFPQRRVIQVTLQQHYIGLPAYKKQVLGK